MWKRWAVCPMRCGTKTAECFLWSGLCGRDFGPRDTYALWMIGALLCQSAVGEGRVGRDDAALRMGRLRAAALRVLTEERIFLAEFDCEHVRNIPTFDWAFLERSSFTTFCHRKVVPKVSARRKRRGTAVGLRLKRYADKLAPAFSTAPPSSSLLPDFSHYGMTVRSARPDFRSAPDLRTMPRRENEHESDRQFAAAAFKSLRKDVPLYK